MSNMLRGSLTSTTDAKGVLGFKGERGYSAYEIAVKNGYQGTEQEWIDHFGLDLTGYCKTSEMTSYVNTTTGDLEELETTDKTDLVSAINELNTNINSLDDRDNYSTTEKVIGTWIDGKPIYRKVYSISGDMIASAWTTLTSLSNVGTLVKGLMGGSANNCVWNDVILRVLNNNIQYYSALTHSYSWLIVEYTKTTD